MRSLLCHLLFLEHEVRHRTSRTHGWPLNRSRRNEEEYTHAHIHARTEDVASGDGSIVLRNILGATVGESFNIKVEKHAALKPR